MANLFKFVGIDNNTTGSALTPFGSGNPLANETYIIKSINFLLFFFSGNKNAINFNFGSIGCVFFSFCVRVRIGNDVFR